MSKKSLIATAALAAVSAAAFAMEGTPVQVPQASLSREEVKAELQALKAAKALEPTSEGSLTPLEAKVYDDRRADVVDQRVIAAEAADAAIAQQSLPPDDATQPLQSDADRAASAGATDYSASDNTIYVVPSGTLVIVEEQPAQDGSPDPGTTPFHHPAMGDR